MSDPSAEADSVDTFISDSTKRDLVRSVQRDLLGLMLFALVTWFYILQALNCWFAHISNTCLLQVCTLQKMAHRHRYEGFDNGKCLSLSVSYDNLLYSYH